MATKTAAKSKTYVPRLKALYVNKYRVELQEELKLSSPMEVPVLEKIVVNVGLGKAKDDKRTVEAAGNTLRKITGQQPVETVAKHSIASFKLREGNKIGLKVTLRGDRMYELADRLINIVLPRVRDFHGTSLKSFDKSGNYSLGFVEQSVFPELTFEDTVAAHGLQFTFVIRGTDPSLSQALLTKFGMPFEKTEADKVKKETK